MGNAPLTLEEQIQENVRVIRRNVRRLRRDVCAIERDRETIEHKIRAQAKLGNLEMVRAHAREHVVCKQNILTLTLLMGKLSNFEQRMKMTRSRADVNNTIQSLTETLREMNSRLGLPQISRIIREYEREDAKGEACGEMVDELMTGNDVDEEQQDELVQQVLAEIGLDLAAVLQSAPTNPLLSDPASLEQRFASLR